mmetsp:Transcript_6582/g.20740  ORF Transcript_6582/g.20740 Transcript_6582/m.20740 type:complete len:206 (-) Transcript_6582:250-867(-)
MTERLPREVEEVGEVRHARHEHRRAVDLDDARRFVREQLVHEAPLHLARLEALFDLRDAVLLPEVLDLVPDERGGLLGEERALARADALPVILGAGPLREMLRELFGLGAGREAHRAVPLAEIIGRRRRARGRPLVLLPASDHRRHGVVVPRALVERLDVRDRVRAEARRVDGRQVAERRRVRRRAEVVAARGEVRRRARAAQSS